MSGEKRFYIVKDNEDRLIAIFKYKADCLDFMEPQWHYTEVVI